MDSSVSAEDEIWFLRVCHHISNAVYNISQCGVPRVMVQVYIFYLDTKKLCFPLQMVAESILCCFQKGYVLTE